MHHGTSPRRDLEVRLANRPGALAELGEVLGRAGVSIEGGGAFVFDGAGHAHFLVGEIDAAVAAVRSAGLELVAVRDIVVVRLHQDRPGELGAVTRALADAGVNIEAVYSDHDHRLVLVVDDEAAAARVVSSWSSR